MTAVEDVKARLLAAQNALHPDGPCPEHLYFGDCPDPEQPDAFDPRCPACTAMRDARNLLPGLFDALLLIDPEREETVEVVARAMCGDDPWRLYRADAVDALAALQALVAGKVEP